MDEGSLIALGLLSSFLSSTQSEGTVPDDDGREDLTAQVVHAINALENEEDVPLEIRRLILDRLQDILWALDRLRIGGPDAVRATAERLAFAIGAAPEKARENPAMKKALSAAGLVWAALLSGPAVRPGVEAWST